MNLKDQSYVIVETQKFGIRINPSL